jgi:hemin uptake protein HemP
MQSTPPFHAPAEPPLTQRERRMLDSRALLGDGREVLITHNGEHYRLTLTRAGKLILTK